MSGAATELRRSTIRTAASDAVEPSRDRVRVTGRGGLPAIVGGSDVDAARTECALPMPTGTWLSVTGGDHADPPTMPMPPWRIA